MPHTTSAEKALRQTEKRRVHNRAVKKALKVQIKKFQAATTPEQRQAELKLAAKRLDKAAAKNIIHRNKAARLKSQLARQLAAPNKK
jgi:small subunit ribosomal protein S20